MSKFSFQLCQMMSQKKTSYRNFLIIFFFYVWEKFQFFLDFFYYLKYYVQVPNYILWYRRFNILRRHNAKRYSGHRLTNACLANGQKVLSDRISYKEARERMLFYPGDVFPSAYGRDSEYLTMGTTLEWCVKQIYKIL